MMNIIHTKQIAFFNNGVQKVVQSRMYDNLSQFQDELDNRFQLGFTHCFLYSIHTQDDPNGMIYWVRSICVKELGFEHKSFA